MAWVPKPPVPGLDTVPILPSDYPLFDWSNWQSSKDALVRGTPTRNFSKGAWNAIIDTVEKALNEAGVEWYDPRYHDDKGKVPYTSEDSKILKLFGRLQASSFNAVCDNVDIGCPSRWAWEVDPNFRGYVGRPRFNGTTIVHYPGTEITEIIPGDRVYAEYILELVRRVNFMLELMRGTVPTKQFEVQHEAKSQICGQGVQLLQNAGIQWSYLVRTKISSISLDGAYTQETDSQCNVQTRSRISTLPDMAVSAGIEKYVNSKTLKSASGIVNRAQVYGVVTNVTSKSNTQAAIVLPEYSYLSADNISLASEKVIVDQVIPTPTTAHVTAISRGSAVVEGGLFRHVESALLSHSKSQLDVWGKRRIQAVCTPISRTSSVVEICQAVNAWLQGYTEFDVWVICRAYVDAGQSVFLWEIFQVLSSGHPVLDSPTSIRLHLYHELVSKSAVDGALPKKLRLHGSDGVIDIAGVRQEYPANVFLLDENNTVRHANAALMASTPLLLYAWNPSPFLAIGSLQNPTNVLLRLLEADVNCVSIQLFETANVYLLAYQALWTITNVMLKNPQDVELLAQFTKGEYASADLKTPEDLLIYGWLKHIVYCNPKPDQPEQILIDTMSGIFSHGRGKWETPAKNLLFMFSGKEDLTSTPRIDSARGVLQSLSAELYGIVCYPQTDNPLDHLLLAIIAIRAEKSHPRIDTPRSNWLHIPIPQREMWSRPKLDAPRRNLMFVPIPQREMWSRPKLDTPRRNLMFVPIPQREMWSRPKLDTPRRNLMCVPIPERKMGGCPRDDVPRDNLLYAIISERKMWSCPKLDAPRGNLLYVSIPERKMWSYPKLDTPRASLLYAAISERDIYGFPRLDIPRNYFLRSAANEMGVNGCPQNDSPVQVCLFNRNRITTHTAETTETPTYIRLFANTLALMGYTDFRNGQRLSAHLLYSINATGGAVCGALDNPLSYQAYQISRLFGFGMPEPENPDLVEMLTGLENHISLQPQLQNPAQCLQVISGSLLSVANISIMLRRIAHGIFCCGINGSVKADAVTPIRIRLSSDNLLETIAHAAISIKRGINSSGTLQIRSMGVAGNALYSPVKSRLQTAIQFVCSSGSVSASTISTIPAHGIVNLIPAPSLAQVGSAATVAGSGDTEFFHALSAHGYAVGLHPAFGIVTIPNMAGYVASRTAITVPSYGEPIGIQLAMDLGGISGRFANIRMHTILPDVFGYAYSAKKTTRSGYGMAASHLTTETAHANAASATQGCGTGNVHFDAVCGGYVRLAQAPWDNPVQTGSNLHITGAWNIQQADNSLYIE